MFVAPASEFERGDHQSVTSRILTNWPRPQRGQTLDETCRQWPRGSTIVNESRTNISSSFHRVAESPRQIALMSDSAASFWASGQPLFKPRCERILRRGRRGREPGCPYRFRRGRRRQCHARAIFVDWAPVRHPFDDVMIGRANFQVSYLTRELRFGEFAD